MFEVRYHHLGAGPNPGPTAIVEVGLYHGNEAWYHAPAGIHVFPFPSSRAIRAPDAPSADPFGVCHTGVPALHEDGAVCE